MLERAKGQFTIEGQVEDIFGGASGVARLARISQTCLFSGALEGESIAEYTAVLPRDGDRHVQGFQRITGKLGEREGSFVVCVTGDYAKGRLRGLWAIVPKSGTGDFLHIRGKGEFSQTAGSTGAYALEYDLRKPRKARAAESTTEASAATVTPADRVAVENEIDQITALESPPAKPPRRRVAQSASPHGPDTPPAGRSTRRAKDSAPVAADASVSAPIPATAQPKRTRKRARPAEPDGVTPAETAPVLPPKARRTGKQIEATPEQTDVPPPGTAKPAGSKPRARRTSVAEPVIEPGSAPGSEVRKRARKPATGPIPEPDAAPEPIVATKRGGRKKSTPPAPPAPLTIVPEQPARGRKAKAA